MTLALVFWVLMPLTLLFGLPWAWPRLGFDGIRPASDRAARGPPW